MRNPLPPEEPWLGRLAEAADGDGDGDFIRRVMDAHNAREDEPWLDWLADNGRRADPMFTARVIDAFYAGPTRRRVAGRIARACVALGTLAAAAALTWTLALNREPVDRHVTARAAGSRPITSDSQATDAPFLPFLADLQTAQDWLSDRTRQASTAVDFTQKQAAMLVNEYALPLRVTGLLAGFPAPGSKAGDTGKKEKTQSQRINGNHLDFAGEWPVA